MIFDGTPRTVGGPRDAAALGVEIVYQDLALCDNLDIVDNMFLGRERISRFRTLDENTMEKLARQALDSLSVRTVRSIRQRVASLSGGQRQTVAIAKSVLWQSKVVILDEPTAALGVAQTEQVLDLVRRLAEQGVAVDLGVAQHERRDAGRRLHRRTVPGPDGGPGPARGRDPDAGGRADHRGPLRCDGTVARRVVGGDGMSAATDDLVRQDQPEPDQPSEGLAALGAYIRDYFARVRGGELGSIPAVVGLIVITVVFSLVHQGFLSAYNLEALVIQAAPIIVMAMGLVFVLLLGEIDLSAGTTGGLCSAITAVLILRHGVSWWLGAARRPARRRRRSGSAWAGCVRGSASRRS